MTRGLADQTPGLAISIHIPRVGDDHSQDDVDRVLCAISIHIPRVGDDADSGFHWTG